MFKIDLKDKMTLTGTIVLTVGIGLLIFTFISAYGFLAQNLAILTSFGEALAPLISTCIRVMYLGVMGWIGSLLTIRGVTIYSQTRQMPSVPTEMKTSPEKTVKEEVKEETKIAPEVKRTEKQTSESDETQPKQTEPKAEPKVEPQPETKSEPKPYEPEIIMLPPKVVEQIEEEKPNPPKDQK
jgi:cytoskeletal protein RodZ